MAVEHEIRTVNGNKMVSLTPMKAIRYQCLECMGWYKAEVRKCTSPLCPLYPYRMGKNPERAGIGGNPNLKL